VTGPVSWRNLLLAPARAAAGFFFPSRCLACDRRPLEEFLRGGVCRTCWESLPPPPPWRCGQCDEPLGAPDLSRCGRCRLDPPAFLSLRGAAPYRNSARDILLAFKFRGADYLAPRIAAAMVERLAPPEAVDRVSAVPARRSAAGRYPPSVLLGEAVASRLGQPFEAESLEKIRPTRRQSELSADRRAANVRGAFRARKTAGHILLVDDIATSGATARECSRALKAAGAQSVFVWCFARASRIAVESEPL